MGLGGVARAIRLAMINKCLHRLTREMCQVGRTIRLLLRLLAM